MSLMDWVTRANAWRLAAVAAASFVSALAANAQQVIDWQPFALKYWVAAQVQQQGYTAMVLERNNLNTLLLTLKNQRALLRAGPQTPDAVDAIRETDEAIAATTKKRDLLQCQIELRSTTCVQ